MPNKPNILLIGGSSDLGRELSKNLNQDYVVHNFDLKNANFNCSHFIAGNITELKDLQFLQNSNYDIIIHISGVHPILNQNNDQLMYDVNVNGLENVLKQVVKKSKATKFIYISSSSVKKADTNFYGKTKLLAEQKIEFYQKQYPEIFNQVYVLRTRGFTPYYSPSYKGDFKSYFEWVLGGSVHIKDVVNCIVLAIKNNQLIFDTIYVEGKNDFVDNELQNFENTLKTKYSQYLNLLNQIKITTPLYTTIDKNSLNYLPQYGINYILTIEYPEFENNYKNLDQILDSIKKLNTNWSNLQTEEYKSQLKKIGDNFYSYFFSYSDLDPNKASVLAYTIMMADDQIKNTLILYYVDFCINISDIKLQDMYGGILSVVANSLDKKIIKNKLKYISLDNQRKYGSHFISFLRNYI